MPSKPEIISAFVIVAERILIEIDNMPSIIRIADIFYIALQPDKPIESQPFPFVWVAASVKFREGEPSEHTLQIRLMRPSGESKLIGEPWRRTAEPTFKGIPGLPSGINYIQAFWNYPEGDGSRLRNALAG